MRHGSAVERRLDRRRGAEHPRGLPRLRRATASQALHRYLEASRYAYADRNAYLADPAFFDVPLRGLLSDRYAAERRALITRAGGDAPVGRRPADNGGRADEATVTHPNQSTTHLTVADRKGNVVSYTFTIESTGGNGIVVPGWGFLLNNELTDFNYDSTDAPEPRRAAASARAARCRRRSSAPRQAVAGARLAGRRARSSRPCCRSLIDRIDLGMTLPRGDRRAARVASATRDDDGRAGVHRLAERPGARARARPRVRAAGAAGTRSARRPAIEFLRGGRLLAAAEPMRRGGGSAQVVSER